MPDRSRLAVLIVAAGRGLRTGGDTPKQYRRIGGVSVLARSLRPFLDSPLVDDVVVVIGAGDELSYAEAACVHPKLLPPVTGGAERQQSVLRGLEALEARDPVLVLIHDAARPFVSSAVIGRVIAGLGGGPAVLPALPVTDTLKRADAAGTVGGTVQRHGLYAAQTPQGFRYATILNAHRRAATATEPFTDDASIAEWAGVPVSIVAGEAANMKLTTAEDFAMAERALAHHETRTGSGYDVHAFGPGSGVVLGGVPIAFDRGLVGHSDADVALHALTDAVLGAIADGDIGSHFPPSDPQWKGASSDRFLAHAVDRVRGRGGSIVHLDLTILAEAPKIGPHRDAMRARIAAIAGIGIDRVAVKATTNEKMGFLGRGEGLAALATATVRLPGNEP
ncbi:MAG: bifunctional 2-C-methyl-D-erythritol 4-phosphate cytidylyltransferase/2-C-methyl-D-erythritol 2,4-cyclodiphosphate synthase [Bauldia sp.]